MMMMNLMCGLAWVVLPVLVCSVDWPFWFRVWKHKHKTLRFELWCEYRTMMMTIRQWWRNDY